MSGDNSEVVPNVESMEEENGDVTDSTNGSANADKDSNEDRKLFVGGLSWESKESDLKEYFTQFGELEAVNLKMNAMTGKSRCFAFIIFKSAEHVNKVFEKKEHIITSKKVDVKRAKARPGKIFVGGLKPEMTNEDVKSFFAQFGAITDLERPVDKQKNLRKTFCFITFEKDTTMKELLIKSKFMIGDTEVDVRKATPKNDDKFLTPSFASGGMGGAGGEYYGGGYAPYGSGYSDYYAGYGGGYGDFYGGGGNWGAPMPYGGGGRGGPGGMGGGKMRGRGIGGSRGGRGRGRPY